MSVARQHRGKGGSEKSGRPAMLSEVVGWVVFEEVRIPVLIFLPALEQFSRPHNG